MSRDPHLLVTKLAIPRTALIGILFSVGTCVRAASPGADPSSDTPLQTIERLHKAMHDADAKIVDSLLHPNYQGLSLHGPAENRKIYVEERNKAVADVAKLRPGAWEIRFLHISTETDSNGMAHVWARYVFLFNGVLDHCGYESYGLFKMPEGWKVISFADTDNALGKSSADIVCPDA